LVTVLRWSAPSGSRPKGARLCCCLP